MGSWNGTCGVTHLPITYDDPVVFFFIVSSGNDAKIGGQHCSPTTLWVPAALPLYGRYNDYGSIERIDPDWNLDYICEMFRTHMIEKEEGENKYWDLPVSKDNVNFEYLIDRIRGDRLTVKSPYTKEPLLVSWMMVHRFAYDELSKKPQTTDSMYSWFYKRFDEVAENVKKYIHNTDNMMRQISPEREGLRFLSSISGNHYSFGPPTSVWDFIEHLANNKPDPDIEDEIIGEIVKFVWFGQAMDELRRTWTPQSGGGSQHCDLDKYENLNRLTNEWIEAKREEWCDWEDE